MDDRVRKQYLLLDDRMLISHRIAVFDECNMTDKIFLVVSDEDFAFCSDVEIGQKRRFFKGLYF